MPRRSKTSSSANRGSPFRNRSRSDCSRQGPWLRDDRETVGYATAIGKREPVLRGEPPEGEAPAVRVVLEIGCEGDFDPCPGTMTMENR